MRMTGLFAATAALSFLLGAAPPRGADAAPAAAGPIVVTDAWLRATPAGAKVAGGYLTISNTGPNEDRLLAASLEGTPRGEVHTMSMRDGVMHMARLEAGLPIAPGAHVTLQPGGDHLMFLDPAAPLKEGGRVSGTLTFAKAGTVAVTFAVAGMAARTAPASP